MENINRIDVDIALGHLKIATEFLERELKFGGGLREEKIWNISSQYS